MRAAYVTALEGKQVAVVCPTTLLARQHAANFRERFEGLGVEIGHLSRLVSATEAKRVKKGMTGRQASISWSARMRCSQKMSCSSGWGSSSSMRSSASASRTRSG